MVFSWSFSTIFLFIFNSRKTSHISYIINKIKYLSFREEVETYIGTHTYLQILILPMWSGWVAALGARGNLIFQLLFALPLIYWYLQYSYASIPRRQRSRLFLIRMSVCMQHLHHLRDIGILYTADMRPRCFIIYSYHNLNLLKRDKLNEMRSENVLKRWNDHLKIFNFYLVLDC